MIIQNTLSYISNTNFQPSFQSKARVVNRVKKPSLNLNEVGIGVAGIIGGLLATKQNEQHTNFEKCMKLKDSNNFENYKKQLLEFLKQTGYNKKFINYVQDAENIEDLEFELDVFINNTLLNDDLLEDEELDIINKIKNREYSSELDKIILEDEIEKADKVIPLAKLFSETDTVPEVLNIKNELKTKYKQNNLFFNNDISFAQACKEAFEILNKNNIPFNGTIIVFDCFSACGINLISSDGDCVIINPNISYEENRNITKLILHEILHSLQPKTLEFNTQVIPEKYKEVLENVSNYAEGNFAHEVHCELYVKKLIKGLSEQEEELFNYLGGTFIE